MQSKMLYFICAGIIGLLVVIAASVFLVENNYTNPLNIFSLSDAEKLQQSMDEFTPGIQIEIESLVDSILQYDYDSAIETGQKIIDISKTEKSKVSVLDLGIQEQQKENYIRHLDQFAKLGGCGKNAAEAMKRGDLQFSKIYSDEFLKTYDEIKSLPKVNIKINPQKEREVITVGGG